MEVSARKPYFIQDEDDALSEMEAGSSGNNGNPQNGVVANPFSYATRNRHRNTNYCNHNNNPRSYYNHQYSVSSRTSLVSGLDNQQPHYLDSCSLCTKPLDNRDIYMYRDIPFCSEECRLEQIERDEAMDLSYCVKSAMKRRKEQRSSSSSTRAHAFHNGTVAAA